MFRQMQPVARKERRQLLAEQDYRCSGLPFLSIGTFCRERLRLRLDSGCLPSTGNLL